MNMGTNIYLLPGSDRDEKNLISVVFGNGDGNQFFFLGMNMR